MRVTPSFKQAFAGIQKTWLDAGYPGQGVQHIQKVMSRAVEVVIRGPEADLCGVHPGKSHLRFPPDFIF